MQLFDRDASDETVTRSSLSVCCVEALRGQFELLDITNEVCSFSFRVQFPFMTAASSVKEVLAGCGLIKVLFCLCIIVWILTRHTATEPPKVVHYAANSNISYFYKYSTDIFMMCSVIGFPSS